MFLFHLGQLYHRDHVYIYLPGSSQLNSNEMNTLSPLIVLMCNLKKLVQMYPVLSSFQRVLRVTKEFSLINEKNENFLDILFFSLL